AALCGTPLPGSVLGTAERFWFVLLYDAVDESDKARTEMTALLPADGDNPQYLAYYIRKLIQRHDLADAQTYLERLRRLEPDSPRTRGLAARLQQASGKS